MPDRKIKGSWDQTTSEPFQWKLPGKAPVATDPETQFHYLSKWLIFYSQCISHIISLENIPREISIYLQKIAELQLYTSIKCNTPAPIQSRIPWQIEALHSAHTHRHTHTENGNIPRHAKVRILPRSANSAHIDFELTRDVQTCNNFPGGRRGRSGEWKRKTAESNNRLCQQQQQ